MPARAQAKKAKNRRRPIQPLREMRHQSQKMTPAEQKRRNRRQSRSSSMSGRFRLVFVVLTALICSAELAAQSRHSIRATDSDGTVLNVIATRTDKKPEPIKPENLDL